MVKRKVVEVLGGRGRCSGGEVNWGGGKGGGGG